MIRIAVAGAGLIGKRHVDHVAASPDAALASIVDPAPGADALAAQHGVTRYATLDEMLARDRPDAVIVATPNQLHHDMAAQLLRAGIPVLLEKPAVTTLDEGRDLLALAAEHRVPVLVGHHRTHGGALATARRIVTSGRIGDVVAFNGTALYHKPDDYFPAAPWRTLPGGGPVRINIIHEVHAMRLLCGPITWVGAQLSNHTRGFQVEDTAAITFGFASGALGTFVVSDATAAPWSWEQTSGEDRAFDHHPDQDCYHVAGTRGSFSVPTMQLFSYPEGTTRSWWQPLQQERVEVPPVDPLAAQLEHFVRVVEGREEPLVSLADGIANVAVVEAIHEAAATGRLAHLQEEGKQHG